MAPEPSDLSLVADVPERPIIHGRPRRARAVGLYGAAIGPLLGGYLLFDRAFAYLHLPGTPLYIGELVLVLGILASVTGTGYLLAPLRTEPIFAVLGAFILWGVIRFVPDLRSYSVDAVRDAALWYYALF